MSTDWNVHCLDCKSTHRFDDANHQDELMLALCRHADSIAALAVVLEDPVLKGYLLLKFDYYGTVDASWFRKHLGHQLLPINEYGLLLQQCYEKVECSECSALHNCVLELKHDGPHQAAKKSR
jgi:hypothetical protein